MSSQEYIQKRCRTFPVGCSYSRTRKDNERAERVIKKKLSIAVADNIEDLEQYGRRTCLKFLNVPSKPTETAENVKNKVLSLITEAGIDIKDHEIDRHAHRICKFIEKDINGEKIKVQPIVAKFTTFRARTRAYRKHKSIYQTLD